jgi:8-oxo-dGTP diphosphatase
MGSPDQLQNPDEQAFLAQYDASQFPHPSVAVDVAIVTVHAGQLKALLVAREEHPFKGASALPGGFVGMDESLDAAAARVLKQKGGVEDVYLEQLYTFGAPGRDPRTRVISVAYYALVPDGLLPHGSLATLGVDWKGEAGGPVTAHAAEGDALDLAFDHDEMLGMVVKRLRGKLDYAAIGFELLPARFTLRALQEVHESVLGHPVNKDSFRRRMLASGRVQATGRREAGVGHRPAELYRFRR